MLKVAYKLKTKHCSILNPVVNIRILMEEAITVTEVTVKQTES
jgi:hypothetical protein